MKTPSSVHSSWSAGSGSGSVTSSAARIRRARTASTSASVSTTAPAAGVDEQRALRHAADHRGADEPARRAPTSGASTTTTSASATASASRSTGSTPPAPAAPHAADAHAERRRRFSTARPIEPWPTITTPLARELARLPVAPTRPRASKLPRSCRIAPTTHCATRRRARVAGVAERHAARARGARPSRGPRRGSGRRAGPDSSASRSAIARWTVGTANSRALLGELDIVGQAPARGVVVDEDLHPMNEPRTESPAGPATAPASSSRSISSAA